MVCARILNHCAWGRGLAAVSLAGVALAALPQAPAAAAHRIGGPRFAGSGLTFRSGFGGSRFGGSRFGFSFGGRDLRIRFDTGRFFGHRPFYRRSYYYPAYYGGLYAYSVPYSYTTPYPYTPYLDIFRPWYSYTAPQPRTIYVYPPPIVRTYPEEPGRPGEREQPREAEPRRPLHPYDELISPSPEKGSVDEALAHIRSAWLTEDITLVTPHLPTKEDISLFRDGEVRQDLAGARFEQLTRDAFRQIRTLRFRYTDVRRPAADEAIATAIHTYVEADAEERDARSVTLRYELVRRDDVWTIRAVRVLPAEE